MSDYAVKYWKANKKESLNGDKHPISINSDNFSHSKWGNLEKNSQTTQKMRAIQLMANDYSNKIIQKKPNQKGIPNPLKSGIEELSGISMDQVKVHYNSDKPAQLNAHAYAQGNQIHISPGQEKHLPHEAWHVVQQSQGRVKPTKQLKEKVSINDDQQLEKEADLMGSKAISLKIADKENTLSPFKLRPQSIQREVDTSSSPSLPEYAPGETPGWKKVDEDTSAKRNQAMSADFEAEQLQKFSFAQLYDGTLPGLASAVSQIYIQEGLLKDNVLIDILKEPLESNWFKAKEVLTTDSWPGIERESIPPHAHSIGLMQSLVNMRGRVWQKFANQVIKEKINPALLKKKEANKKLEDLNIAGENFGLKDSVGSESVTSDIDLSAKGENTELGVAIINEEFRKVYGQEPGAFFDINVYSSDWMFGGDEILSQNSGEYLVKPKEEKNLSEKGKKIKNDQNEVWSMVKIRRNMQPSDWVDYKNALLSDLPEKENVEMQRKFMDVELEYNTFKLTVEQEVANAKLAANEEMKKANEQRKEKQKKGAFEENGEDHHADAALEMQVSNRQYEKIIEQVKILRLQIAKLEATGTQGDEAETLILTMHNQISRGLTYANEVYATQGAVLHTVYGNQGAKKKLAELKKEGKKNLAGEDITSVKYQLSKEMYLQSMNENVGDTLHSLNHFEHDPQYAVYRAGKYIDRLCSSVEELIGKDEALKISVFKALDQIGKNSVKEKSGAAGQDPMATHEESSFFFKYSKSQLPTVKSMAMTLGSQATNIFKKTKQPETI
ncbi:MAG: hypothetical protein RLZZ417_1157 [Bacteroidota bacterium]